MTASIALTGVTIDFPVYSVRAQSLRSAAFSFAIGGRLFKDTGDIAVVRALSNINLEAEAGETIGLVGHNGSGKTTLLRVISGIYEPTAGVVKVEGEIASMISLNAGVDMESTGLQNIYKIGMMRMQSRRAIAARIESIADFSGLSQFLNLPVKVYSSGMMARLMFSIATEFDPQILVLDEWLSAGDADFAVKAKRRMQEVVSKAQIVVIASHDHELLRRICTRILVLEAGECVYAGPPDGHFGPLAE